MTDELRENYDRHLADRRAFEAQALKPANQNRATVMVLCEACGLPACAWTSWFSPGVQSPRAGQE